MNRSRLAALFAERADLARKIAAVDDALAAEHAADATVVHITPSDEAAARKSVDRLLSEREKGE